MIFNVSGGSSNVNFKVIAYNSEAEMAASTPANYTVGVISPVPVSDWGIVGVANPDWDRPEGFVYLYALTDVYTLGSNIFSVFKKGELWIRVCSAKQRISGNWVNVEVRVYHSGVWTTTSVPTDVVLYDAGTFSDRYTHTKSVKPSTSAVTYDTDYITIKLASGSPAEAYEVFGPMSLKDFKTLSANFTNASTSNAYACMLVSASSDSGRDTSLAKTEVNIANGLSSILTIDLTSLDVKENLYVYIGYTTNGGSWSNQRNNLRVNNIRMEV